MILPIGRGNRQAITEGRGLMMEFPITELMDDQACYDFLEGVLHPKGVRCPEGHKVAPGQAPHMSDRAPLVDYRCRRC